LVALVAVSLAAADPAAFLKKDARQALRKGDVVRAYLLYSQASALNPKDREARGRALALRTRALSASQLVPPGEPEQAEGAAAAPVLPVSPEDWSELRRPEAPVRLQPKRGERSFRIRAPAREVIERVLESYGIGTIFDHDYTSTGTEIRFELREAPFEEAAVALQVATGTFLVPVSEHLALAARDSPQKRQELEHTIALAIPLPETTSVQEAQELARAIQQLMEIQKFGVDSAQRMAVIRDRESKALPAARLFQDVLRHRSEVMIEIDLLESNENSTQDIGLQLPTRFPVLVLSEVFNTKPSLTGVANLVTVGGGRSLLGVGLTSSELLATMSQGSTRAVQSAQIRSVEGQAANFHIGDKYPILTAGYFGATPDPGQQVYTPPPTFNFEDLGIVLKITPIVHSLNEVTLQLEADYKVLGGEALNGIPVISNRKITSTVRLRSGESAVVAGLIKTSEARTRTGIAGLSRIPLLGRLFQTRSRTRESAQTLFVVRPRILSAPPAIGATNAIFTGPEARMHVPL
jgi:type II secretory pathway component HofQ